MVRLFNDSVANRQNDNIVELYLRLLVNITYYTHDINALCSMLGMGMLHGITDILASPFAAYEIAIYTIRLINNILVVNTALTGKILEELILSNVISLGDSYSEHQ